MTAFLRWRMVDPTLAAGAADREYLFFPNPNKMSSPFPERQITVGTSTAPNGTMLAWESPAEPVQWSFGGSILDADQYEALRSWVYDRPGHVYVYDHYGRRIDCVLQAFQPESPEKMRNGRYWYHTYTVKAYVWSVGAPAAGLPA